MSLRKTSSSSPSTNGDRKGLVLDDAKAVPGCGDGSSFGFGAHLPEATEFVLKTFETADFTSKKCFVRPYISDTPFGAIATSAILAAAQETVLIVASDIGGLP